MKKKLFLGLSLALAAAFACFSFAACSGDTDNDDSTNTPPPSNKPSSSTPTAPAAGTAVEWAYETWTYTGANDEEKQLEYAFYYPENYSGEDGLPLITFIPDSSFAGKPLTQVVGASGPKYWATQEKMSETPAAFLVLTFSSSSNTDSADAGNQLTSLRNETGEEHQIVQLIDSICDSDDYNIDSNRLYLTGQSMGGIFDWALNTAYPDKFAATVYVACQPGGDVSTADKPNAMYDTILEEAEFLGQKFVYIASRKDMKSPYGQDDVEKVFIENEVEYTKNYELDPADIAASSSLLETILADGNSQYFLGFPQVNNGNGGVEHMASFDFCYALDAVFDWLLAQTNA